MVSKTALVVGGLAAAGAVIYIFFIAAKPTGAGGGVLGTGGQTTSANNGPTSQSEPSPFSPSAPFRSTPSLATGSANGSLVIQETYSPYYSTQNDYSSHVQNDYKSQSEVTIRAGLLG